MLAAFFDPGLLTGVCVYDFKKDSLVLLDEFDYVNTGIVLDAEREGSVLGKFGHYGREVLVGWESYRIMKGPQSQAPYSLEVIGELKYLSQRYGYTTLKPAEPKARMVITADMLKRMGWYPVLVGKKDAYSACQHFLAWCLRENILPEKYKEPLYGGLKDLQAGTFRV